MDTNVAIMIVPTGIGASIGGYAGDASSYAQKAAEQLQKAYGSNARLIVNPNIVNAAVFSGITDKMLYVEGWCIEQFVKGNIGLIPSKNNKIGIIFDKAIPERILNIHINTINALKTVYGIDIMGYEITEEPAGVEFFNTESGISSGTVKNQQTLEKTGRNLLKKGADALAVVCFFENPPEDDYESGEGVDIVGGVEAVISHYLSQKLLCPCVHAPAFDETEYSTQIVHPKVSAEYITPTFLPCLMFGLQNAPKIVDLSSNSQDCITKNNLKYIALPHNALGSSVVLDALKADIPVFAIKENTTVLNVDKEALSLEKVKILNKYEELEKDM